LRLDKVSERVYANCDGETGGNVGIVVIDDAVVAVDAQYPVSAYDFRESIATVSPKPVTHLLLTHIHGDHIFGNQAFEDCTIVSHRRLKEKMEESLGGEWAPGNLEKMLEDIKANRPERAWLFEGLRIVLPTETFEDRYTLPGLEFINLGGHSDCSSVVYVPEERVLFAGDNIFAKTFPWAGALTADPDLWIEAFRTMLQMDVDTIIPGHGPLCDKAEVEVQLAWFEAARDEMKALIAGGASVEEAVGHDGYPEFYESSGDRRERSLRHWYQVWSRKG
jgi:glyoxylase-like metal-dependent hydrolase (beta-lactamase superfamily II)